MTERFVANAGTISIDTGDVIVVGTGTAWAGRDRAGSQIWVQPADGAPYRIGTVAEVDPRGVYGNLELPLVSPWEGDPVVDAAYELVDGPAIANGTTQAAIFARYAAHLEQNMGLAGRIGDEIDFARVPNNSLFWDPATRLLHQWRNGILEPLPGIGVDAQVDTEAGLLAHDEEDAGWRVLVSDYEGGGAAIVTLETPGDPGSWSEPAYIRGPAGADGVQSSNNSVDDIIALTQSEYDALPSPSATTFYIITD